VNFTEPTFPIYATSDGLVESVKDGTVVLALDWGHTARYYHLTEIAVKVGDRVSWGQLIGQAR